MGDVSIGGRWFKDNFSKWITPYKTDGSWHPNSKLGNWRKGELRADRLVGDQVGLYGEQSGASVCPSPAISFTPVKGDVRSNATSWTVMRDVFDYVDFW